MQQEPDAMGDPRRGSNTNAGQIEIEWDSLTTPANGDSTILSYSLEWDSGTSGVTYTVLVGVSTDSTDTSYTLTSGITTGTEYNFRVKAKNAFGWGDYSSVVALKASAAPS